MIYKLIGKVYYNIIKGVKVWRMEVISEKISPPNTE